MNKHQSAVDGSRFCQVSDTDSIRLQPEEPAVTRWQIDSTDEFIAHLLKPCRHAPGAAGDHRC